MEDEIKKQIDGFFEEEVTPDLQKKPEEKKVDDKKKDDKKEKEDILDDKDDEEDLPEFLKSSPDSSKEQKQKGKKPEENIAILRKQRDEYKQKSEKFSSLFGESDPEAIEPLVEFINERAEGPITKEFITELVDDIKKKDDEINEWKQKFENHEKKLQHVDITTSEEFQTKFKKPYEDSSQNLLVQFASVTSDKKVIAPIATKKFHSFLMENAEAIDAITVKQKLKEFKDEFEKESGEEADIPAIKDMMASIRDFADNKQKIRKAYTEWKTVKEEEGKKSALESQQLTEAQKKQARKVRISESTKAFNSFELDLDIEDINIKELFTEEFKEGESFFEGEKEIPAYSELITRGVKARLFDKIAPRLKELLELEKKLQESERQGFSQKGERVFKQNKSKESDWLEG